MSNPNLVVVQTFADETEAAMAKSALEDAGIHATIQTDAAGGIRPHPGWAIGGYKLLVPEADAPSARDLVESLDEEELREEEGL